MKTPDHQPVLLKTVVELLAPAPGLTYLDLTAGYGGHAGAVAVKIGQPAQMVLVDRDQAAIGHLRRQFPRAKILPVDFDTATKALVNQGTHFDMILMDLGVSSPQLAQANRGFSFNQSGPLDMRMDRRQQMRAADIVNHYQPKQLADLIREFGQERFAGRIARAIVDRRPIISTDQLVAVIAGAVPSRGYQRIHPATRTFQALRLAVNDELGQLAATLPRLHRLLKCGGRLVIISFHSLEDRLVKQWLRDQTQLQPVTKKPISGKLLDATNRRARSSRLRAAIKPPKFVPKFRRVKNKN